MAKETLCIPWRAMVFILSILAASGAFAAETDAARGASSSGNGAALTLSDYLTQVSTKHLGYKAADQTAKAAKSYADEYKLLFLPTLEGNASVTGDGKVNPFKADDHRQIRQYSLGVSEQTPIGIKGKVAYNYFGMDIPTIPGYTAGFTQIELSGSLLRNFWGSESKAQEQAGEAGALAKAFGQSYVTKAVMLEAESAYWRLALAREMVEVQKDALTRAQRIEEWTSRRVRLQLADRAEGLQASTNLQARKLDYRSAQDDARAAAQAFNSARGILSDDVSEKLVDLDPNLIARMDVPARTVKRDDVTAAEYTAKATKASAELARERNKPTLEVFGIAPLTEPDAPSAQLALILPTTARATTTVGVRLSAPLDFSTLSHVRQAYAAEAQAADWTYQRKAFEEEKDWQDLSAKFRDNKERLKLYVELEKTQRTKLDYERERQQRGRSTLQQVLIFETDYAVAQAGRIQTLANLLTLNAQMKLYGVSYESR